MILSVTAWFSPVQGGQNQADSTATLAFDANYHAEVSFEQTGSKCTDQITVHYGGSVQYTLLAEENALVARTGSGMSAQRSGSFRLDVQGGGECVGNGTSITWAYKARPTDVPPHDFPQVGVSLNEGDYSIEDPDVLKAIKSEGQIIVGGKSIPFDGPGTAAGVLAALKGQSLLKVSDALHGKFAPYSKNFSRSNAVSDTTQLNNPGMQGSGSMTISYHLTFGRREDIEAVIIPQSGYAQWMPEGGKDESADGNILNVKVVLQKKGKPGSTPTQGASFKFELVDVSREPGVCLNWPPKSQVKDPPDFDLKIDKDNPYLDGPPAEDGQSAKSKDKLRAVDLTIVSHDYGAWGKLRVTATLEDHTEIVAHLQDKPDVEVLSIPKDDNGNHIADAWEKTYKVSSPKSDDDKLEWQEMPQGDGLSAYEEYRGFRVQGGDEGQEHVRTDPRVPDVFVYDQDDIGTGNLPLSGLAVHSVDRNEIFMEIDPDPAVKNWWIINFNGHNANLGKQHAIWLQDANPGEGTAGADIGGPGPPKTSLVVKVGMDPMKQAGAPIPYMLNTISHELAHAANVWHHGDNDYSVRQIWKLNPDGTWAEVPTPKECKLQKQTDTCYGVAAHGGQESGVQNCIMRYEKTDLYEWDKGPYRWRKGNGFQSGDFYGGAQPSGTRYCRAVNGTGVNGQGYIPAPIAGDATNGNCEAQFCANDIKQCWFTPTYAKH